MTWLETLLVLGLAVLAAYCLLGVEDTHNDLNSKDGA